MRVARGVLTKKALPVIILALISTSIILFYPPANLLVIMVLIANLSLIAGLVARSFTSHKYALLSSFFIFILLTLRALDLLDPINAVLAISLLVGISILIK